MSNKKETPKQEQTPDGKILLTGLWLHKDSTGTPYFTGNLGTGTVLIFKNKNKTGETSPDYFMFLAPKVKPVSSDDENPFEGLL